MSAARAAPIIAVLTWVSSAEGSSQDCMGDVVHLLQRGLDLRSRLGPHAPDEGAWRGASACSNKFGTFGLQPLYETQLVPAALAPSAPAGFENFHHWPGMPWYEADAATEPTPALMISTKHKFAICTIPKVASSEWITIFGKMMADNPSIMDKTVAKGALTWPTPESMAEVFSDPTATRYVLVRDPLSRFASAFMNKCDPSDSKYPGECPMVTNVTSPSMKDAVAWALSQNLSAVEPHWMMQSDFCELKKRVAEYTVIGAYSKDNLAEDASCVMQMAGVEQFNSQGTQGDSEPFWQATADKPVMEHAPPSTTDSDAAEIDLLQKLFTQGAAHELMGHMRADYDTFNLPRNPVWKLGATGQYYDMPVADVLQLIASKSTVATLTETTHTSASLLMSSTQPSGESIA